jgi:MFS family permease
MFSSILGTNLLKNIYKKKIKSTLLISLSFYLIPLIFIGFLQDIQLMLGFFLVSQFGRGMIFVELSRLSNNLLYKEENKSIILSVNGSFNWILSSIFLILNSFLFRYFTIEKMWTLNSLIFGIIVIIFVTPISFNKYYKLKNIEGIKV